MSSPSEVAATGRAGPTGPPLLVDRIACTAHGVCAALLPEDVDLDEWGYPVVRSRAVDPELGEAAVRLCPARALSLGRG